MAGEHVFKVEGCLVWLSPSALCLSFATASMTYNARQLGFDGTVEAIRRLLVERFRVKPDRIRLDEPLFGPRVGLTSLEGMELLAEIEREFEISIRDIDDWAFESPSLANAARYIVEHSSERGD